MLTERIRLADVEASAARPHRAFGDSESCNRSLLSCLVAKSGLTVRDPMDRSMPGLPVLRSLPEFAQTPVHRVGDAIQPSHPPLLFLLPLIFPSIGVFSVSWLFTSGAKDWSFSFSISPSNEYSGLIPFKTDWLDLLAVQGALKSLPQPRSPKASVLQLSFLHGPTLTSVHDCQKTIALTRYRPL